MRFYLFFIALFLIAGCEVEPCGKDKSYLIKNSEKLATLTKDKKSNDKSVDWDKADLEIKELVDVCYKKHEDNLTKKEDREFWANVSSYYMERYGSSALLRIQEGTDEISRLLDENMDKWIDGAEEKIQSLLKEFSKEDFQKIEGAFLKELDGLKEFLDDLLKENE